VYVDCIKGKQTKHTDIYGLFDVNSLNKEKYFITFIDVFLRYGYVYLLHEKSQVVNALDVYIDKVERQLEKKVKMIRLYRGGEYYGRYDESRQYHGLFARFLEKCGICA